MMKVVGCLQARMSSKRLPGKVLARVEGRPMIFHQIERLRRISNLSELIVATSTDTSDDLLVDYVESLGVEVHRGSLNDVLHRYVEVIDVYNPDVVVRFTADCPLVSPSLGEAIINEFLVSDVDYLSNTLSPTFPDGLDVEVVNPEALRWVNEFSRDLHEHEHVTLGVYRRPERFKLSNFANATDCSDLRWTVDSQDDLVFVRKVYAHFYGVNPNFEFEDILNLVKSKPWLSRTSADAVRNAALEGLDTGAMNA